jgi:hypothetical protein
VESDLEISDWKGNCKTCAKVPAHAAVFFGDAIGKVPHFPFCFVERRCAASAKQMEKWAGLSQERRALSVTREAAQRRQSDAGRIEAAIDGENLAGDIACPVAAQEKHRFRQFFL